MLGRLLGGFITILVGTTILPTVADQVYVATHQNMTGAGGAQANANLTGAATTITNLVTLFFALGVLSAGIAVAVGGLKDAGLM